jgi:hypothetical protein
MRRIAIFSVVGLACVLAAYTSVRLIRETSIGQLDGDQILIVRTPGGMLEVTTLIKNEDFAWRSQYECPFVSCAWLLKPTISEIRIPVHYTYRVPLAESWSIVRKRTHYELTVPPEQPTKPAAMDFTKMQLKTDRGWLSPSTQANREMLLRQLGPELERRSTLQSYVAAQRPKARQTVSEFAQKWMREQGVDKKLNGLPVKVLFKGESTSPEP